MTELLTAAQMRAIEQAAIDSGEVTGLKLMERAGQGVVEAIFEQWPELADGALGSAAERGASPADIGARTNGASNAGSPGYFRDKDSSSWFSEAGKRTAFEGRDRSSLLANAPRLRSRRAEPRETGGAQGRRAVVLCGPGNNGGDGFVVARLLTIAGLQVEAFLLGPSARLPADAGHNHDLWLAMGGRVTELTEANVRRGPAADLYIDAILGGGLNRAPQDDLLSLLQYLAGSGGDAAFYTPRLVAIDAPSGLNLDSGFMMAGGRPEPAEATVPLCALTVTFEAPKLGHFLADGPAACGRLAVVDLDLHKWRAERRDAMTGAMGVEGEPVTPVVHMLDRVPLCAPAQLRTQRMPSFHKASGHKYDHGHALVVSGGAGRTGAARLAARGALRVGAGLVTLACPAEALAEAAAHVTAIMLREVDGAEALEALLAEPRLNAICLGPGLGVGQRTRDMVRVAIKARRMAVLDADALTSFEDAPERLFEMIKAPPSPHRIPRPNVVLTPHAGEFRRLFPDLADAWLLPKADGRSFADDPPSQVARAFEGWAAELDQRHGKITRRSKVEVTREAAARSGAIVLLKGPDTVVATPSGSATLIAASYDRAAPWLATAGAGDVLAGMITGLAARRQVLEHAVTDAAWLHVEAALKFGPGLIAEDLPEQIPAVFADLMARA